MFGRIIDDYPEVMLSVKLLTSKKSVPDGEHLYRTFASAASM